MLLQEAQRLSNHLAGRCVQPRADLCADEFLKLSSFQCGYCAPGMIMSSKALLDHNPHPTEGEIREAIAGNLCRCTAYVGIVKAIQNVAAEGVA